jgi:phospholipid/cholesterol/gamma-HCH transport system permease protein
MAAIQELFQRFYESESADRRARRETVETVSVLVSAAAHPAESRVLMRPEPSFRRIRSRALAEKMVFDRTRYENYATPMQSGNASAFDSPQVRFLLRSPLPQSLTHALGRKLFRFLLTVQGLGAFALITLGVIIRKFRSARHLIWPLVCQEISRSGSKLLAMFLFLSGALGLLVIGQTVSWLTRVGAINYLGSIMVIVVVRELGPLLTALLVMARIGAANVIELGTSRALGEVEALEALGIDPVHYLVAPRVIGMSIGTFALTIYLILGALISGYLWAFLQDVPLRPGDYFRQLAGSLSVMDFAMLATKTLAFGFIIAIVTCYHGLAQPLRLEEVSAATVRAVAQSVICCVLVDALFIIIYLAV